MFRMKMKNVAAVAFVLIITAIYSAAQDQNPPNSQTTGPDAKAILRQVGETYSALRSYHFEGRFTHEQVTESMGLRDEFKREELIVNAAIKPDRYRIESKNTHFSVISVSDGKNKWVYAPGPNEYTISWEGAARTATRPLPTEADSHLARARNIVTGYSHIDHQLAQAKFIGEEKLKVGERLVDCFVIEADYASASAGQSSARTRKLWIDKSRYLVLREIQQTRTKALWGRTISAKMTYSFTFANLDNQVTEALFAFVPPEGAKEVAELRSSSGSVVPPRPVAPRLPAPNPSTIVGKDAITFALKDLDGNQVDLQSLKGKVVLLDFWASWCGPCVAEMPHIEKLHKDFKNKGLVVLGINYNEELEVARAYIQNKGYTFTNLLDEGRETSMKYGVSGIPQVFIIDREGKIKWHARGYSSGKEIELRSAVEKILKGGDPQATGSIRAGVSVSPVEKAIGGVDPSASDAASVGALYTPAPMMVRLSTGVLNGQATKKAYPIYPSEARQARPQGPVQVEITVSESGKVIEAKAISGHELLRGAAEQAAMQWEFTPSKIYGAPDGAPVKMQGILVFNFTLQ